MTLDRSAQNLSRLLQSSQTMQHAIAPSGATAGQSITLRVGDGYIKARCLVSMAPGPCVAMLTATGWTALPVAATRQTGARQIEFRQSRAVESAIALGPVFAAAIDAFEQAGQQIGSIEWARSGAPPLVSIPQEQFNNSAADQIITGSAITWVAHDGIPYVWFFHGGDLLYSGNDYAKIKPMRGRTYRWVNGRGQLVEPTVDIYHDSLGFTGLMCNGWFWEFPTHTASPTISYQISAGWTYNVVSNQFSALPLTGTSSQVGTGLSVDDPITSRTMDYGPSTWAIWPSGPSYPFELEGTLARVTENSTTKVNVSSSGQYTIPILVDPERGLLVAETAIGSASETDQNGITFNDPAHQVQPVIPRRRLISTTTNSTFHRAADGTVREVLGTDQHMIHILSDTYTDFAPVSVGQTLSATYEETFDYIEPSDPDYSDRLPTQIIKIGGDVYQNFRYIPRALLAGDWFRLQEQTANAKALSQWTSAAMAGNSVFGVLNRTGVVDGTTRSTWFKGSLNSLSWRAVVAGEDTWGSPFLASGACFDILITGYSITITEIVADDVPEAFSNQFNEQFQRTVARRASYAFTGKFFLDGSIRNIFASQENSGGPSRWLQSACFSDLGDTFEKQENYASAQFIWDDPFIWRITRDNFYVDGQLIDADAQQRIWVPRWRLDYSTSPIRCVFDGADRYQAKPQSITPLVPTTFDLLSLSFNRES